MTEVLTVGAVVVDTAHQRRGSHESPREFTDALLACTTDGDVSA
jgi:hypothetical protein